MSLIPVNTPANAHSFIHLNSSVVKKTLDRDEDGNVHSLNIFISLSDDDSSWILKIRNEEGDMMVWDEPFTTARDALTEGLRAISQGDAFATDNTADESPGDSDQRFAIVIHYRQAFVDWLNANDNNFNLSVVEANFEPNIYIVDGINSHFSNSAHLLVQSVFEEIFDAELSSWCSDENVWPGERDWDLFQEMFDFTVSSTASDNAIHLQDFNLDNRL